MKAIFPGTFDPFTIGHYSVVKRALTFMDEVIIGIGVNDGKRTWFPTEKRVQMIRDLFKDEPRISVEAYTGLTVDFASERGAGFIIRGIRTVRDFEYEETTADINGNFPVSRLSCCLRNRNSLLSVQQLFVNCCNMAKM